MPTALSNLLLLIKWHLVAATDKTNCSSVVHKLDEVNRQLMLGMFANVSAQPKMPFEIIMKQMQQWINNKVNKRL